MKERTCPENNLSWKPRPSVERERSLLSMSSYDYLIRITHITLKASLIGLILHLERCSLILQGLVDDVIEKLQPGSHFCPCNQAFKLVAGSTSFPEGRMTIS
jgi:hypothetical protein